MILSCTCKNAFRQTIGGHRIAEGPRGADFQDARYGSGRRVHNRCASGGYNCTVCGNERPAGNVKTPQD